MDGSLSVGSAGSQAHTMGMDRSLTPGGKSNVSNANVVNESTEVKPRSLRFTWSMKTTSSRDPNEIMAEIKKVCGWFFLLFRDVICLTLLQVLDANNCDYEQRERFLLLCVHGDPNTDSLVQVRPTASRQEKYFIFSTFSVGDWGLQVASPQFERS